VGDFLAENIIVVILIIFKDVINIINLFTEVTQQVFGTHNGCECNILRSIDVPFNSLQAINFRNRLN